MSGYHRLGPIPNAAPRSVYDAAPSNRVIRVHDSLHVSEGVLDLSPLIEAHPTHDPVGDGDSHQHFFEDARLGVRAVENRYFAAIHTLREETLDFSHHETGLIIFVVPTAQPHFFSGPVSCPQLLRVSPLVLGDHRVRGVQNVLGGTIVLFEEDRARVLIVLFELFNVSNRRAPKSVDRLVGVPHDRQLRGRHPIFPIPH